MIARHFTRFAFPDDVSRALAPFLNKIKKKYDKESPEGRCARLIDTFRLEANPDFGSDAPDLRLLVLLGEESLPTLPVGAELDQDHVDQLKSFGMMEAATRALEATDPVIKRQAWTAVAELWLGPAVESAESLAGVGQIDLEVINGKELTFARSRNAPELDLAYLTSRTT
jgi:hypothetical protein